MLIQSTNLNNVRLMDFYQVMYATTGFLRKEDLVALGINSVTDDFNLKFTAFDAALKQARKTGYTEAIITADDVRDNVTIGFTLVIDGYTRFPDTTIADAATRLQNVLGKYGSGVARLPQREETATLTNIVTEMRSEAVAPYLDTVGLRSWVNKLDETNRAFEELYTHRTEKEAEFITGLTRTERTNMQAAFEKLAQAIDAFSFINGETNYQQLANKINQAVADAQQATRARATQATNKKASKGTGAEK